MAFLYEIGIAIRQLAKQSPSTTVHEAMSREKQPNPVGQEFKAVLVILLALFCSSPGNATWSPWSHYGTEFL